MRTRTWISIGFSLVLHATLVMAPDSTETAPRRSHVHLDLASADEIIVLTAPPVCELEEEVEYDPIIKDAKVGDHGIIGLGDPRFNADAPFEGRDTNGVIGIGGGAGGSFGGRRGGRRNLRAGGGGRASAGLSGVFPTAELQLIAKGADGESMGRFPLQKTSIHADVSGWLAATRLTQSYANPFEQVVEAVYVFPLPSDGAVSDFEMMIGDRRVVGVVRLREEAQRIYDEARARGQTASLLSQERPNVFTQSVANIPPGGEVDVSVTLYHGLRFDEGAYEYVMPMTVAPRYTPPAPAARDNRTTDTGPGAVATTTVRTPVATNFQVRTLPAGMRSGRELELTVELDAGLEIQELTCVSHEVDVVRDGSDRARVTLSPEDAIPDRDFVLRWRVGTDRTMSGYVSHADPERGGFFSAFLVPNLDPADADVSPREVTFVVDTSGSMGGVPIDTCKQLMGRTLDGLRPFDRVNVIRFAGGSGSLFETPQDATPDNLAAARTYVDTLSGGGGTEMLAGLNHWMAQPRDPRYVRIVVFLTDGRVNNEQQILATIKAQGQDARWFSLGIGGSVNRYLVEGIAEHGGGACEVVSGKGQAAATAAAERLLRRFESPLLLDVEFDAGDLAIHDVYPRRVPDLFAGEPIVVTGRYDGDLEGTLVFRGTVAGRTVEFPLDVQLRSDDAENEGLANVWARKRVHELDQELLDADESTADRVLADIETVGLDFQIVTRRTSFVAVDENSFVPGGGAGAIRILQPNELPSGVRYWGVVGAPPTARGIELTDFGLLLAESRDGKLMVARVDAGSAAARAGLHRGYVIENVGSRQIQDADHLRAMLENSDEDTVSLGYRNGAGKILRDVVLEVR